MTPAAALPRRPDAAAAPDAAAIRERFKLPRGKPVVPDARATARLAYLIKQMRAAPVEITHGAEHEAMRGAVRTLLDVLPGRMAGAEAEAAAAAREGRTTDMGHFAWRARALLDAAQPFAAVSGSAECPAKRYRNGHWHAWARLIALQVQGVLFKHGRPWSVQNVGCCAVTITHGLLALGGVSVAKSTLVDALRDLATREGNQKSKYPSDTWHSTV